LIFKKTFKLVCGSLCLLLCLFSGAVAVVQHGHGKEAELCNKETVKPDLHCAKSVTTRFDQTGRLWITWFFNNHIYVQYSDDLAEIFSKPVVVNIEPENIDDSGEDRVKIAFGQEGEIYLAWTMKPPKKYSGHIRFSRSVDTGKSFSKPITVDDDEFQAHRFAAMETNKKGEIFLAWLDKRDLFRAKAKEIEYAGSAIYYSRSTDKGQSFSVNKKIADHSCECCRVSMDIDKNDLPVVLWRHVFPGSMRDHAITRFSDEETPGEVIRVSRDKWAIDACPHHGPDLKTDQEGTQHVVWFANSENRQGLSYAKMPAGKNEFTSPTPVGDPQTAEHPYLLSHENNLYLVWMAFNDDRLRVYLKKSTDHGDSWGKETVIAETDGSADHPFLLKNGCKIFLSWHTRKNGMVFKRVQ